MEDILKQIYDNIFANQDTNENIVNEKTKNTKLSSEETTDDSLDILKLVRHMPQTEIKKRSKISEEIGIPSSQLTTSIVSKQDEDDEYADYGRRNKKGIHFQIISDYNVSIEIVPQEILTSEMENLIIKYKGVFDPSMKLWILPYINYLSLYNDLNSIQNFKYKIYKVGSIAKKCFENKDLTKLEIKRRLKEEIIDYTKDNMERDVEKLPKNIKNALYDFQLEGVKFGIEHHCRFLLADEMGVGKTIQAIALSYLYRDDWPVLIVCPGSMKYLWKGEIQTWLGFKDYRIDILNTSKQKISNEAYFYIISYDLVSHILKKLKRMNFNFVILDEAHCIKNRETIRAKNILPIAIRAKRLILMTGTPLLAKPLEGYPLLYALRPDLFPYFKQYAYRYCDPQPTPFGISWSGTSNTKELHWLLSTLMVRRLKKEVLNKLPPKRRQKVEIKTDPEILEKIKEARVKIKGRNGTLLAYTLTSTAKKEGVCEYIMDILSESGDEKIIVFAYHHEMMNSVEDLLKEKKIDYIRIDGSTKQDKRYDYVKYFQTKASCRVAIVSIIAGSTGITLNKAHIVIFAELTWTPSIMIQAEDRAHRIGQKSNFVDIKYLYGPGTLDDFILDKLQKKLVIVSTTIDDKRENFGVQADPNLIHAGGSKGKNSKELLKYDNDDSDFDSDNEENGKNMEKKMMEELLDHDPSLQFVNINSNKKNKKRKKNKNLYDINDINDLNNFNFNIKDIQNIAPNDNDNINEDSDDDNNSEDSLEKYFDDLDEIINQNNNMNININEKDDENKNQEKIILNNNLYNKVNDNINESISQINYSKSQSRLNDISLKIFNENDNNNDDDSNKKKIIYPKDNKIKKYKKNRYPKEDSDDDDDDEIYLEFKKNTNKVKDKKVKYRYPKPKRGKTPNSSNPKRYQKLPGVKPKKRNYSSVNKKDNNNNINNTNNEVKEINNKELFEKFDNNLMINLHKENMRRNMSQVQTKQSQNSLYNDNDDDNNNEIKYKTQPQRFIFVNDKNIFNENFVKNMDDKVKLI